MLLTQEGFEVVGVPADGETAVVEAARLIPDVVLLDIQLPDLDGFAVAERLGLLPSPPVVVLTSSRDAADYGVRVSAAAARGFIRKEELSGARLAGLVGAQA